MAQVLNKYTICMSKRQLLIHKVHLLQFNELWKVHDPHASHFLPLNHFLGILTGTSAASLIIQTQIQLAC